MPAPICSTQPHFFVEYCKLFKIKATKILSATHYQQATIIPMI